VVETAPSVVAGRGNQSAFHGVAMDVADHFGASFLASDIAVKVAFLSELLALASQFARCDLLEGFEKLGHEDRRGLIDQ